MGSASGVTTNVGTADVIVSIVAVVAGRGRVLRVAIALQRIKPEVLNY